MGTYKEAIDTAAEHIMENPEDHEAQIIGLLKIALATFDFDSLLRFNFWNEPLIIDEDDEHDNADDDS